MSQPPFSRNIYLQSLGIPKDTRAATFNDGSFLSGIEASVGSALSIDVGMKTGDSQIVFSGFQVATTSGELLVEIFGESTFTGGTPLAVYNTNKNSTKQASINSLVGAPTVSVLGDLQAPPITIYGDNASRQSLDLLVDIPLILKPNTEYIFRATHNGAQTRDVSMLFSAFDNIISEATFP